MRKLVYIAGPYSQGDQALNVAKAMKFWHILYDLGYAPVCPHLTHFLHMFRARGYQDWLEYDLEILQKCDALLRLDGLSNGADSEVKFAGNLGIPIAYDLNQLVELVPVER